MAKVKVNKAKISRSPKKKNKLKVSAKRTSKSTGLTPSERRWYALAQNVRDKSKVLMNSVELAKTKTKNKIHDLSFKLSKYVEKDEYGTSKFSTKIGILKTKFKNKVEKFKSDRAAAPDPLDIQRFEGEGGTARDPLKTPQELE